jgi:hypothetical protein
MKVGGLNIPMGLSVPMKDFCILPSMITATRPIVMVRACLWVEVGGDELRGGGGRGACFVDRQNLLALPFWIGVR